MLNIYLHLIAFLKPSIIRIIEYWQVYEAVNSYAIF